MSFLGKYFLGAKSTTPQSTTTTPTPASPPSPDQHSDSTWDIITREEAIALHTDRLTLFLGPPPMTVLTIPLTAIPASSTHLTYLATLAPMHRYSHHPRLSVDMVSKYGASFGMSIPAMAMETSWLDIIKLAITAQCPGDVSVEAKALAALRRKDALAMIPGSVVEFLSHASFAYAMEFHRETGAGGPLLRVLREIGKWQDGQVGRDSEEADPAFKRCLSARPAVRKAGVGNPVPGYSGAGYLIPGVKPERKVLPVYGHAGDRPAWRASRSSESKGPVAVADGLASPVRQPTVPPSVEALKSTALRNFEYPPEMQMAGRK